MTKAIIDYVAEISQPVLDKYVAKGKLNKDESGYEKYCNKCDEYWALTSEFWYEQKGYPLRTHCWCKACYLEIRKKREGKA